MHAEDITMSGKPTMLSWTDFPPDFVVWKLNPTARRHLQPGPRERRSTFLETLIRFIQTIEAKTLIPGHGPILEPSVLWLYILYFSQLTNDIKKALSAGWTLRETL